MLRRQAVSQPERNEHGGAGRVRHGRADAAGESVAHAERGEGDSAVHRAGQPGLRRAHRGRRIPQCLGAVRLARFYRHRQRAVSADQAMWSKHIIWGNHLLTGGVLLPRANALSVGTTWGGQGRDGTTTSSGAPPAALRRQHRLGHGSTAATTSCGARRPTATTSSGARRRRRQHRVGHLRGDCDNIVWGTADGGDNIVWGTDDASDNIVWGTADGDNIVWGTSDGDNIVWGTATAATTSCGAPPTATTSCGAPRSDAAIHAGGTERRRPGRPGRG